MADLEQDRLIRIYTHAVRDYVGLEQDILDDSSGYPTMDTIIEYEESIARLRDVRGLMERSIKMSRTLKALDR